MTQAVGAVSASLNDTFLVTLHGAKSVSEGMRALSAYCEKELPGLRTFTVNYGDIGLRAAIYDPNIRRLIYRYARSDFDRLRKFLGVQARSVRIVVVAQSLGTLVLYENLREPVEDIILDTVILVSSILPQLGSWHYFIEESRILRKAPFNFTRPFDLIAPQASRISNERTLSGTRGLGPDGIHLPVNAFKVGGHFSYNPDDFEDICEIVGKNHWTPRSPTDAVFMRTLTRFQRARLQMYRAGGLC